LWVVLRECDEDRLNEVSLYLDQGRELSELTFDLVN
jgi:hypothetical protein